MKSALLVGATLTLSGAASADAGQCIASAERGQQVRAQGHLAEARAQFMTCQASSCPGAIAKDCAGWLDEVERAQPTLVVLARDPEGREVLDVTVSIDGARVASLLDGRPIAVEPGPHTLRVEWTHGPPTTTQVLAREGEKQRLVDVGLVSEKVEVPASATPVGVWVLGGVGVAAMGVGGALWGVGLAERAHLYDVCGVSRVCTDADKSGPQAELLAGDLAFFGGLAVVVAASVWLLVARTPARVAAAPAAISF